MEFKHVSILLHESVDFLITDKKGIYVDCTMGGAGHSSAFAAQLEPEGLLIGIDQDDDAIVAGSERLLGKFACQTRVAKANFENFAQVLDDMGIDKIDGINTGFSGECPTLIVHNIDQPGCIVAVTSMLAKKNVNIATMQVYRSAKGQQAVMVVECDQLIPEDGIVWLAGVEGVQKVTYFPGLTA